MYTDLNVQDVIALAEAALVLSFVVGVILHEAGHAMAARLVGLDLRLISLGQGPAFLHLRPLRVALVLRWIPVSGFVAIAARPGTSRYRFAAFIAAGPGVNIVLLSLAIGLDQAVPYYDAVLVPAAAAQALLIASTLAPFKHAARGGIRRSDGLQLWMQLARTPPDMFATQYAGVMALVFPKGHSHVPPSASAPDLLYQILRSDRMIDVWGLRDAVASVRMLLAPGQLNPAERAVALDFLVSSETLFGATGVDGSELEAWSVEACALAPGIPTTLTRAGVLATTGRAEQAMDMLLALPEDSKPIVSIFRYWLHMAQAAAGRGYGDLLQRSLEMARKAADAKVVQRKVMQQILARVERQPLLLGAVAQTGDVAPNG